MIIQLNYFSVEFPNIYPIEVAMIVNILSQIALSLMTYKEMSPVQLALEVALHELTILHGLHVTDVPNIAYTWDIDTSEVIEMLAKVLEHLRLVQRKENVQDLP